jgi:hypothetical protein
MAVSDQSAEAIEELQRAADDRMISKGVRQKLRMAGLGGAIMGAGLLAAAIIAPAVVFHHLRVDVMGAVAALIGGFLMVAAVWVLASPTPRIAILAGFAWLTVAAWGIYFAIQNVLTVHDLAAHYNAGNVAGDFATAWIPGAVLVWFGIHWGIESFVCYVRLRHMPAQKPSPDLIAKIDQIVKEIKKSKPKIDPDAIEFGLSWKGNLAPDLATFVDGTGQEVIFAKPGDVSFIQRTRMIPQKGAMGDLEVGSRTLRIGISEESFQRYVAWKERAVPVAGAKPAVQLSMDLQRTIASVKKRRWEKREKGKAGRLQ